MLHKHKYERPKLFNFKNDKDWSKFNGSIMLTLPGVLVVENCSSSPDFEVLQTRQCTRVHFFIFYLAKFVTFSLVRYSTGFAFQWKMFTFDRSQNKRLVDAGLVHRMVWMASLLYIAWTSRGVLLVQKPRSFRSSKCTPIGVRIEWTECYNNRFSPRKLWTSNIEAPWIIADHCDRNSVYGSPRVASPLSLITQICRPDLDSRWTFNGHK